MREKSFFVISSPPHVIISSVFFVATLTHGTQLSVFRVEAPGACEGIVDTQTVTMASMPNDLVTQLRTAKSMLGEDLIGQQDYERVKRAVLES